MGHKVNPIGLRVGVNRTWDSRWFASRAEYGRLLHEDMHIRDVGMGTGYLAQMVAPLVGQVVGVDHSRGMLERAGEKAAAAGLQQITLREGAAEHLPIETGSVDVAMCHMLLHHVVSPQAALRELKVTAFSPFVEEIELLMGSQTILVPFRLVAVCKSKQLGAGHVTTMLVPNLEMPRRGATISQA